LGPAEFEVLLFRQHAFDFVVNALDELNAANGSNQGRMGSKHQKNADSTDGYHRREPAALENVGHGGALPKRVDAPSDLGLDVERTLDPLQTGKKKIPKGQGTLVAEMRMREWEGLYLMSLDVLFNEGVVVGVGFVGHDPASRYNLELAPCHNAAASRVHTRTRTSTKRALPFE
jgi:hypothetical protein